MTLEQLQQMTRLELLNKVELENRTHQKEIENENLPQVNHSRPSN